MASPSLARIPNAVVDFLAEAEEQAVLQKAFLMTPAKLAEFLATLDDDTYYGLGFGDLIATGQLEVPCEIVEQNNNGKWVHARDCSR